MTDSNGEFLQSEAGRMFLCILEQAETDLKEAFRKLEELRPVIDSLFEGTADPRDREMVRVVRDLSRHLENHRSARRWYMNPPSTSTFPVICAALGRDYRRKRELLREWLFLPYSDQLLGDAIRDYLKRRPGSARAQR